MSFAQVSCESLESARDTKTDIGQYERRQPCRNCGVDADDNHS